MMNDKSTEKSVLLFYPKRKKGGGRKHACHPDSEGKDSSVFFSTGKVGAAKAVCEKIILALLRYFSAKPCLWEHFTPIAPESGTTRSSHK
jgi:hypothetical protein